MKYSIPRGFRCSITYEAASEGTRSESNQENRERSKKFLCIFNFHLQLINWIAAMISCFLSSSGAGLKWMKLAIDMWVEKFCGNCECERREKTKEKEEDGIRCMLNAISYWTACNIHACVHEDGWHSKCRTRKKLEESAAFYLISILLELVECETSSYHLIIQIIF